MKVRNNKFKLKNKNLTSKKIDISNFEIKDFKEGWAVIIDKKTNKQGWINEDYTQIINPIFIFCYDYQEGFQESIEIKEKNVLFDEIGKILTEMPF